MEASTSSSTVVRLGRDTKYFWVKSCHSAFTALGATAYLHSARGKVQARFQSRRVSARSTVLVTVVDCSKVHCSALLQQGSLPGGALEHYGRERAVGGWFQGLTRIQAGQRGTSCC